MSRLSQCATCDRGRWNCGHYIPEDDTECPHYINKRVYESDKIEYKQNLLAVLLFVGYILAIFMYQLILFNPIFLIPIAVVLLAVGIYWIISRRKNKKQQKMMDVKMETAMNEKGDNNDIHVSRMTTRNLIQLALRKLGIAYDFDENNYFLFTYHGEYLKILANDDSPCIYIYDIWWYEAPLDDIDNLNMVHRAVNEYNIIGGAKLTYTYDNERGMVGVHTILRTSIMEQIPNQDQYLRSHMDFILTAQHNFYNIMEQMRRGEYSSRS